MIGKHGMRSQRSKVNYVRQHYIPLFIEKEPVRGWEESILFFFTPAVQRAHLGQPREEGLERDLLFIRHLQHV